MAVLTAMRLSSSVVLCIRIAELAEAGKTRELVALLRDHIRSWEPLFMKAIPSFAGTRTSLVSAAVARARKEA